MQKFDVQKILDNNEKIIKTLRPQKQRFYFNFFIKTFLWTLWLFCTTQLVLLCFNISGAYYLMPLGLFLISFVWAIPASIFKYKKTIYLFTDRRIIICTGIVNTTIVSLNYNNVFGIDFSQSCFDKMFGDIATLCLTKTNSNDTNNSQDLYLCFIENATQEYKFLREATNNKIKENNIGKQ